MKSSFGRMVEFLLVLQNSVKKFLRSPKFGLSTVLATLAISLTFFLSAVAVADHDVMIEKTSLACDGPDAVIVGAHADDPNGNSNSGASFVVFGKASSTPVELSVIEAGRTQVTIGKQFSFDKIVEAHQCLEDNQACGKIVVLT